MNLNDQIAPEIAAKLETLRPVSPRNPVSAAHGRAAFLSEAAEIARAVSKPKERRLIGWMYALQSIFTQPKKEQSPMFNSLATIILAVSLIIGGGGITIAGAQSSLPDQPLYTVKLISEDARIRLASDPSSQLALELEFTERRAAEIQAMTLAGQVPPEAVYNRYQDQVDHTLQLAAGMPESQAIQSLQQIRLHLQDQQQVFLQMKGNNANPQVEAVLARTRQMIQERLQWVLDGLANPAHMQEQLHLRDMGPYRNNQVNPGSMRTTPMPGNPGMGNQYPMTTGTLTPGSRNGNGMSTPRVSTGMPAPGPIITRTSMPGPGPMSTEPSMPGSGMGPGPMPTQKGPNPQPTSGMGGGGMRH